MDNNDVAKVTGAAVRAEAARRGMSIRELARQLGVSHSYVSYRTKGRVAFNITDLDRVSKVLDVPLAELLPRTKGAAA